MNLNDQTAIHYMRRMLLTIELPFVLNLPNGKYQCRLGQQLSTIQLELIGTPTGSGAVPVSVVIAPFTGEVKDEAGTTNISGLGSRHTRATIEMIWSVKASDASEEEIAEGKETARRFLNTFIDCYRFVFEEAQVYSLAPAEFYSVRYNLAPRFVLQTRDRDGHGTDHAGVTFGDWPLTIAGEGPRAQEDVQRFTTFVSTNAQAPLGGLLILNACNHLARGQYRQAVIEAGTALDVAVEESAHRLLVSTGSNPGEALRKLESLNTRVTVQSLLKPSPSWNAKCAGDYDTYDRNFRAIRNRVVHDALEPTKKQATEFSDLVGNLVKSLSTL